MPAESRTAGEALSFSGVSYSYGNEPTLSEVSFSITSGDFAGIVGPNGGGKTTLLKPILGLLEPDQGSVRVFGQSPAKSRRYIGYLPQYSALDDSFPISVEQVVGMGLFQTNWIFPFLRETHRRSIGTALEQVQLSDLANRRYGTLSGGQKQRCLIARAIVSQPRILILDEPTASIDSRVEKDIYELLRMLNRSMTILLVSHDISYVSAYVKSLLCVNIRVACNNLADVSKDHAGGAYGEAMRAITHQCNL